jgi:hypothetical protein
MIFPFQAIAAAYLLQPSYFTPNAAPQSRGLVAHNRIGPAETVLLVDRFDAYNPLLDQLS